jgi:hypothetical protein
VVHDRVPRPIEACCHGHLGDSHADGVGQSLPQGTGGGFDTGGLAVFRMAGRTTSPLAESLQLFQRQVETRDMKQRIQERTPMSGRENEAVAVGPKGITRVELERAIPECISHGRRAQGQPGMARVGLLHHVHSQETERVDTQLIQCGRSERRRKGHRRCHGCACPLLSRWNIARPKNEDPCGTLVLADQLGFQLLPLAPGVLALAGYFQEACRIGTRITTVLFPLREQRRSFRKSVAPDQGVGHELSCLELGDRTLSGSRVRG